MFNSLRMMCIFCLTALLFICLQASPLRAAQSIGTVIGIQGRVTASDGQELRVLEMTSPVYVMDTIITGPDSKIQILFDDDSILAQGPDSESTLSEYSYLAGGDEDSSFLLDMTEGTFRVITGQIVEDNPDEGFRLQTPLAVIGIRGTMTGHQVHPNQENHYSLDLQGTHTVNVTSRNDNGMGVMDGDFQALDIWPGLPMGQRREMTPQEQEFMSQSTGITQFNPSPGSFLANGSPGTPGPDTREIPAGDTGTMLSNANPLSGQELPVLDGMELPPLTEVTDITDLTESTAVTETTTIPTGTLVDDRLVSVSGYFIKEGYAWVPPYLLPFSPNNSIISVYGEGATDIAVYDTELNKLISLGIYGSPASDLAASLPISGTDHQLGMTSDADWGYWQSSEIVTNGTYDFVAKRMYHVTVDVASMTQTDLAGTYTGSASGIMTLGSSTYVSDPGGIVTANISDIQSGTIDFSISVPFDSGTYSYWATGTGNMSDGVFDLHFSNAGVDVNVPGAADGASDVFGAVGSSGTMAGTWHFWSDTSNSIGAGEFHGTHD